MTGLYYSDNEGNWVQLTGDVVYSAVAEEGVYKDISFEYEGNTYRFSFTWNESAADQYAEGAGYRLYATSYPSDLYYNITTIVVAVQAE